MQNNTSHDLLKALENARDTLQWIYGCSEPNREEIEKAIEEATNAINFANGE